MDGSDLLVHCRNVPWSTISRSFYHVLPQLGFPSTLPEGLYPSSFFVWDLPWKLWGKSSLSCLVITLGFWYLKCAQWGFPAHEINSHSKRINRYQSFSLGRKYWTFLSAWALCGNRNSQPTTLGYDAAQVLLRMNGPWTEAQGLCLLSARSGWESKRRGYTVEEKTDRIILNRQLDIAWHSLT